MRKRKCRGVEFREEEQIGPFPMFTLNTKTLNRTSAAAEVFLLTVKCETTYFICSFINLIVCCSDCQCPTSS